MKRMPGIFALIATVCLSTVFAQEPTVLDATDVDTLRAHAGQDVVVEGLVTEIGTTKTNSITFINMGLPKKVGFVAVVFQKNYGVFPDGFSAFKGQKLRVSGKLDLYQGDKPQVEVRSAEQIQIVAPE
ncbi:MAG: hypothetical protein ACOYM3_18490 [Terrimicrobiaceae bacterium]